ncbi:hypothetical protein RHODOSMS8_02995 [Rhodobiaceae bacterium]|nr:hypothetical protein RHODOSMS8_02995 [Rhodobiaceae bacterium]
MNEAAQRQTPPPFLGPLGVSTLALMLYSVGLVIQVAGQYSF